MATPHKIKTLPGDLLLKALGEIGDGLIVLEGNQIAYANDAFCKISGFSDEELCSLPSFLELFPEEERPKVSRQILVAPREGKSPAGSEIVMRPERLEFLMRGKQKEKIHLEITVNPAKKNGSDRLILLVRDISREAFLKESLREQEHQYRILFQNNPNPMIIYDLDSLAILDINDSAIQNYGYSKAEFLKLTMRETWDPQDVSFWIEKLNEFKKSEKVFRGEVRHRRKDGILIDVEVISHPVRYRGKSARVILVYDMTEHKKTRRALLESEGKYQELFNNANDAIFLFGISQEGVPTPFLEVNDVACQKFGYTREEFLSMTPFDIGVPEDAADVAAIFRKCLEEEHLTYERTLLSNRGLRVPVESSVHAFDWNGRKVVLSVVRDLTDRKRAEETIRRQAYYDTLTNLPNRTLFKDRLEQAMKQVRHNRQTLAVVALDLDRFKNINETLGHGVGDKLLLAVTERLMGALQESETLSRFGGDEFTILLPQVSGVEEAAGYAKRIIELLTAPFRVGPNDLHVTTSIGISFYPSDGETSEALLRNAETAMYRAKEQGRNDFQLYASVMNVTAFKQLLMENSLRRALEKEELVVYYQPQVDLGTRKITGAEALVRWRHPDLGLVFPTEFVGLAEDTGLIVPLGEWVMRKVCARAKKWHEAGYPKFCISVNLSGRQFQQQNLMAVISGVLRETGLDPQYLGFEVTESIAMKNADFTVAILTEMKKMGIHISLDDFGTGYSSLSYLKRFPMESLKIDPSFVRDITMDPNDAAIVAAVIAMAHSLKLKVVAEGVETEEQLEFLKNHGCDQMQGYYFSHPLAEDELLKLLSGK